MREMKLKELKEKSPTDLLAFAEENEVENASAMPAGFIAFQRGRNEK